MCILDLVLHIPQMHECSNLSLLCSGVVNYCKSSKYCILLIGVFMLSLVS